MDRRAFLAAAASTTLVAAAGCSGDGGGDSGGDGDGNESGGDGSGTTNVATASESAAEISASGTTFDPLRQEVEPGTEVVWTNDDDDAHNLEARAFHDVAEEWSIDSTPFDPGETVSHTFEESGVYEYLCAIHGEENMCGAVIVGDASLDEDLPCEGTAQAEGGQSDDESGEGGGNETEGNETEGNETDGGGNQTEGNDSGGSGNETNGNETGGNETGGNESA